MKLINLFAGAATAVALGSFAGAASATVSLNVNETFASGATFSGVVDFADDYSSVTGVSGTLKGYQYGTTGYIGTGSDPISWVWYQGTNFDSNSPTTFGTFLMDGTGPATIGVYSNFITFDYNYANPNHLTFDIGPDILSATNGGNNVIYSDPLVSGTFGVPEPATWALMMIGFGGLGAMLRSAKRKPSGGAATA